MKITLDVQDNRFETFMELIKALDYVSVHDETINEWQQSEVNDRLLKLDSGKMKTRLWEEAREDIFKK